MDIENIKRLPFVVEAYKLIYPQYSRCEICGLPWAVCKSKTVPLNGSMGVFALCEHCWNKATLMEVMKAHTKTYIMQYTGIAEENDRERFIKENPLEQVLQCVEKEYNKTNNQK